MKFHQTRYTRPNKFRGPFAETFSQPYAETFADAFDVLQEQGIYRDIFDPENLHRTIWHVHTQASNPFYGLTFDDIALVDEMLSEIEFLAGVSPGQLEFTGWMEDDSLTITKASEPLSPDYHLSYNKVSLNINDVTIEWYFLLSENDTDVEGDKLKNVQKDPSVAEILYEKSEGNKGEFNNTGYSFSWSDGRKMENRDVTMFIREKKKEGNQNFIADFPVVQDESESPMYTITKSTHTYYKYFSGLDPDPLADKDNLKSDLFMGNQKLEYVYDGDLVIDTKSPSGDYILLIRRALNEIYKNDKKFKRLEGKSNFDHLMLSAVSCFQIDFAVPRGTNGVVGKETMRKLDGELVSRQVAPFTYTWTGPETPILTTPVELDNMATMTYAGVVIEAEQLAPDQEKVDKAIAESDKYEKQSGYDRTFNADFLTAVDLMSEMDMGVISLDKREQMLRQIGDFTYINGTAERAIVGLINSTPAGSDSKSLLTWLESSGLLPVFESSIHGDNYDNYQAAIRLLYFNSMSVEQTTEQIRGLTAKINSGKSKTVGEWAQEDHIFYWLSPGVFSQIGFHMHRINYNDMEINDQGRLTFSMQHTYMFTEPEVAIDLDPFEMVMVKFLTDGESLNAAPGDTVFMPAINLLALYNQQWNQEAFAVIDVALTFVGGIGLLSKAGKLAKLIAALDLAIGIAALAINDYRSEIGKTAGGREFLKVWDTVNGLIAIYGLARVAISTPQIFKDLKYGYTKFRRDPSTNLNQNDLNKIDQETSAVLKNADEVRLEQIKNASREERVKDLGTGPNGVYRKTEGEVGAIIEAKYGYLERYHNEDLDWVSLSGEYKGKTFDHFGLDAGTDIYHSDKMENFLPSIDKHFQKADIPVLDTRFMRPTQKQSVLDYIEQNWSGREFELVE